MIAAVAAVQISVAKSATANIAANDSDRRRAQVACGLSICE
jgi:hypothetical protein